MLKRFTAGILIATIGLLCAISAIVLAMVTGGRIDWGESFPAIVIMAIVALLGMVLAVLSRRQIGVSRSKRVLKCVTALIAIWGLGFGGLLTFDGQNVATTAQRVFASEQERGDLTKARLEFYETWIHGALTERDSGISIIVVGLIAGAIFVSAMRSRRANGEPSKAYEHNECAEI